MIQIGQSGKVVAIPSNTASLEDEDAAGDLSGRPDGGLEDSHPAPEGLLEVDVGAGGGLAPMVVPPDRQQEQEHRVAHHPVVVRN